MTTPNRYWNKLVLVKGHVRSVAANPPGTNRGSYVLRDSSDTDITILTTELPAQGKEYTVAGNVEQMSADQRIPILREFRRELGTESSERATAPRRSPRPETEVTPTPKGEPAAAPAPAPQPTTPHVKEVQPTVVPAPSQSESSAISIPLLVALVAFALVLVVLLVVMMRPKPAPAVAPAVAPAPAYLPPVPLLPTVPVRPTAPPPPSRARANADATVGIDMPTAAPAPTSKATEVFFDLGAELVVSSGPDRGKHFNLTKPTVTIGRSGARQNEVTLTDTTVSREHAKIIYSTADKTFRLINESSTNPVLLNGKPVESSLVQDNDAIQLGATVLKLKKI